MTRFADSRSVRCSESVAGESSSVSASSVSVCGRSLSCLRMRTRVSTASARKASLSSTIFSPSIGVRCCGCFKWFGFVSVCAIASWLFATKEEGSNKRYFCNDCLKTQFFQYTLWKLYTKKYSFQNLLVEFIV